MNLFTGFQSESTDLREQHLSKYASALVQKIGDPAGPSCTIQEATLLSLLCC